MCITYPNNMAYHRKNVSGKISLNGIIICLTLTILVNSCISPSQDLQQSAAITIPDDIKGHYIEYSNVNGVEGKIKVDDIQLHRDKAKNIVISRLSGTIEETSQKFDIDLTHLAAEQNWVPLTKFVDINWQINDSISIPIDSMAFSADINGTDNAIRINYIKSAKIEYKLAEVEEYCWLGIRLICSSSGPQCWTDSSDICLGVPPFCNCASTGTACPFEFDAYCKTKSCDIICREIGWPAGIGCFCRL